MLGGPHLAARAGERALAARSKALVRAEALLPAFLCPVIERKPSRCVAHPIPGPSSSSQIPASSRGLHDFSFKRSSLAAGSLPVKKPISASGHASQAAVAPREWQADHITAGHDAGTGRLEPRHTPQSIAVGDVPSARTDRKTLAAHADTSPDWTRKYRSTRWRREMDFNRYSPPIRRRNLPEDAPALYEDEIKASSAWLPETRWSLALPDDYPLRHELMLILDSLDYISKNIADPDCANMLAEALQQARELIWSKPDLALQRPEDLQAALYLAGKLAETYVKLDADDSLDQLISFLGYVHKHVGPLPLACFHALAARAGMMRRYAAVLKICQVAEDHNAGQPDAELLHLRLRALIAKSTHARVSRYWEAFELAGITVPRKTFDLLLRTHVRQQNVAQVNEVLEAMPRHGYEVDARAWLTILRGYQTFRPTLAALLRRDAKIVQSPTLDVVNRLLMLLSEELDVDGALLVLRLFRIPSVDRLEGDAAAAEAAADVMVIHGPTPEPSAETYAILTGMLGRLGRDAEALAFFRLALTADSGPETEKKRHWTLQKASAHVMKALLNAGHPRRAMRFATDVLGLPYFGVAPNRQAPAVEFDMPESELATIAASSMHYRVLLECTAAVGSVDAARRVLVHLLKQGRRVDRQVLQGVARVIFTSIDADALESIRMVRSLLSRQDQVPNESRQQRKQTLLTALQDLGVSDRIILASQHSTDLPREQAGSTSKSRAAKSTGRPDLSKGSRATKDELRDWLIADSSSLLRDTMSTAEPGGHADALERDLSRPLCPEAYAMRIRVYAVVRRDHESAQKVYQAMLMHGVKPNMMHIAPLVEGLTASGKLQEAQQLKQNAREIIGCQPTLRIHTALIQGYVRAGDSQGARNELQELVANGHQIDDTIANIIEAAQAAEGKFTLTERPVNEAKTHNVTTRFHTLMRMRRYLAAQELVQSALDTGMRPDKVLHDAVRRSVGYLQKQIDQVQTLCGDKGEASLAAASGKADGRAMKQPPLASDEERRAHIHELTRAARLATDNKDRITSSMRRRSNALRKATKDHRKKVIQLILDFADGKLHQQAGVSGNSAPEPRPHDD
ncbi:hypothetical protein PaG_02360 [Moesziomyces aphidis]|uniref:Pentatricopeptide repeat protein n=1 Tax=Moesziomyces aphidis TaxID=84754 RepID=W3VQT6_MOEAP|nr:hypothetical protein PaG_02360 [Moesziomyces aphidis]